MQHVQSLADVTRILAEEFTPPVTMRIAYSLDRMYQLMELLGNPQNELKIVHVAGTSGKTSTCYYTNALLVAAGQKTGMTVSPHVDEINERVQINGVPLEAQTFCAYFNDFLAIPGLHELKPSYFECMVAFAFWVFVREKVEYAVVEVGLGGLGDGTNVIDRDDKVCVITDIGYDHMNVLGDTIVQITHQKAGIIQPHNLVFTMQQEPQVLEGIQHTADAQAASLAIVRPSQVAMLAGLPPFAARNWQLAYATYQAIAVRDGLPELSEATLRRTAHTTVPARMEVIEVAGKTVVLDGSHNQQKLAALRAGLEQRFGDQPKALLISFVRTKADLVNQAAQEIVPSFGSIIVTSYQTSQDFHHSSLELKDIEVACQEAGATDVASIADPVEAFQALLNRPEPVIVVTGSFYLLNHIRPIIKKLLKDC